MKKVATIFSFAILFFYNNFAEAENILGGEVEVERNVKNITITFTPTDASQANAVYVRRIDGIQNGLSRLTIRRRGYNTIIILVNRRGGISEVAVGYDYFSCANGSNRLVCAPAQTVLAIWRLRLSIERRIEEALRIPPLNYNLYLPPYPEE